MIVIIKEREYEYISDHPDAMAPLSHWNDTGWRRSKGDFKFPVFIGGNKCFIKRFNNSTESISGWKLLESLVDKHDGNPPISKHEKNLPKVHDIVKTIEKGKNINYVFLEFIEGDTLSRMLSEGAKINLEKLTDDLFSAFQSLNKYGFWFADFFEKNICADTKGNFFLVDLDSAQPISTAPNIDMWGEKEYWALVLDFYKKILHKQHFKPSHINGVLLNYLQMIFLILRIKIYNSQKEKEYNEVNIDHSHLNNISPAFKEIFNKVLENRYPENSLNIILKIKNLIKEKIILTGEGQRFQSEPVIKQFTLNDHTGEEADDNFTVENGKAFSLTWEIENALDTEVHRNGVLYKKMDAEERSIEINEFYDGEKKRIVYTLLAANSCGTAISKSLPVILTGDEETVTDSSKIKSQFDKPKSTNWESKKITQPKVVYDVSSTKEKTGRIYFVLIALMVAVITTFLVIYSNASTKKVSLLITKSEAYEGNILIIYGDNLPTDSSKVEVYFNEEKSRVIHYSQRNMQVIVPNINEPSHNRTVKVAVVVKGDTIYVPTDLIVKENFNTDGSSKKL